MANTVELLAAQSQNRDILFHYVSNSELLLPKCTKPKTSHDLSFSIPFPKMINLKDWGTARLGKIPISD